MRALYHLYSAVLASALTAYAPVALTRAAARGVPLHVRARLGLTPPRAGTARAAWIHAVSVGEALAAVPLVEGLRQAYPELPIVVTTVTETGARVVGERLAGLAEHRYFPLDLPAAARRVVEGIRPAFFVCLETELWPNVLRELTGRRVPTIIANGRLSDRSFRRYRWVRRPLASVLRTIGMFGMQSAEDARRMIELGAPPERVLVTGNLKLEAAMDPPGVADAWRRLLGLVADQPVWIAGSTHRGEDEIVLAAHRIALDKYSRLALVLAPRHPERVPEVMAAARDRGFTAVRRSQLRQANGPTAVIVLDTIGELAQLYTIADVVFVGGSLVPAGGHNMLEPALRKKPVLFGPYTSNFRDGAALLLEAGAATVVADGSALAVALVGLLDEPARASRVGTAGYEAAIARHGAVRQTLELIARCAAGGLA